MIKDRNGKDLTEAEDIKKKWPEHTEKLQKKTVIHSILEVLWTRSVR